MKSTQPRPAQKPHRAPLRRRGAARVIEECAGPGSATSEPVIEHPDGWYWVAPGGRQQFGPFESAAAARADRDRTSEESPSEGETLEAAELEAGIGDWIDAGTGAAVEGHTPPHLDESG